MLSQKVKQDINKLKIKIPDLAEMVSQIELLDSSKEAFASVLIISTVLDQVLELTLMRKMEGNNKAKKELFNFGGPCRNLSAKIKVGYALGLYEKHIYDGMNITREVRNIFAHIRKDLSFENETIVAAIQELTNAIWGNYTVSKENAAQDFIEVTVAIMFALTDSWPEQLTRSHEPQY